MEFAQTNAEAAERFEKFKGTDPFPEIPPALLNSADVQSYVAATGMIFPFHNQKEREKLKTASYEIDLLGKAVYWDEEENKVVLDIKPGTQFVLRNNSIAFVTLEPMLRVPAYIALRFNLKITHVYRGLLLGTGPLIDPGYTNRLSVPLHNLTTNDYTFIGGEPLIWMEFTKLSPKPSGTEKSVSGLKRFADIPGFPERKNRLNDVEDYLRKADLHRPIRSSIPEAIKEVKKLRTYFDRISWIGVITIILTVIFTVWPIVSLVREANMTVMNANERVNEVARQLDLYKKLESANREKIDAIEKRVASKGVDQTKKDQKKEQSGQVTKNKKPGK